MNSPRNKRIGLIGCGVIGERRLESIEETGLGTVSQVFDTQTERSQRLALRFGAQVASQAEDLLKDKDISIVIVATPNGTLAANAQKALENKKHVLVEKPGAISLSQVVALGERAQVSELICKVGYNHRFHPAALRIKKELKSGHHGKIFWIRAAYGHGGRPGYEKEWRFKPELSGGGEIIDQGVHLLDLIQWWCEEPFDLLQANRQNAFYQSEVEDNGFLTLRSASNVLAQLHCSVTQWKNLFRVEISTEKTLFVWEGLGNKNYGPEILTLFHRKPEGGAPIEEVVVNEPNAHSNWKEEWTHFYRCVEGVEPDVFSSIEESKAIFNTLEKVHQFSVNV